MEWTTHQLFGLDQNVAIIADLYVEENSKEITSDRSRESFLPEQLPEASFELELTQPPPEQSRLVRKGLFSKEYLAGGSVIFWTPLRLRVRSGSDRTTNSRSRPATIILPIERLGAIVLGRGGDSARGKNKEPITITNGNISIAAIEPIPG